MRNRRSVSVAAMAMVSSLALAASSVHAGDDWDTDCVIDAGRLPGIAQVISTPGPLGSIRGCLGGSPAAGIDFEDMYVFRITDPVTFSATTVLPDTTFNTQLWLLNLDGSGLLANDNISNADVLSRLLPMSNDGSGAQVNTPGIYLIAITGFDNDAFSGGGQMYNVPDPTEISGPDGPGGGPQPIVGWNAPGEVGDYLIILTGAAGVGGVPAVSGPGLAVIAGLIALAGAVLLRRRTMIG